ncbi:hypothetical protein B7C42_07446 [Nocardia cerradoensis]|uniref:Uncharacterized protein n=1 Tax=Nocardia cerradoensis TaxID=85688 RepID=A0A231GV44_9NOCA|nr:hypothetical protein B7C42_07446 [Nocardia cerradoensis]
MYLVWNHNGTRHELLIGEAEGSTREANLKAGWAIAHQHQLLTPHGRDKWQATRQPPLSGL